MSGLRLNDRKMNIFLPSPLTFPFRGGKKAVAAALRADRYKDLYHIRGTSGMWESRRLYGGEAAQTILSEEVILIAFVPLHS